MDSIRSFFRTPAFSSSNDFDSDPPVIHCWRDGDYAVLWCARCRNYHKHGIRPEENLTSRLSHCDTAYDYILSVTLGDLPDAVRRDMERTYPRGPEVAR